MALLTLTFAQYDSITAWGSSSLRAMRRGPPARVLWEREHHRQSDAMTLGAAVHCRLLEPTRFEADYAHKPDGMSFATKEGKAWRDGQSGRTILTHAQHELVQAIFMALCSKDPVADVLAKSNHREATVTWRCSRSGEECKARPDIIAGHWLYDLKVSRHADSGSLSYRAWSDGWMHQLAHYRTGCIENGMDVRGGRLIVVSPAPPHFVHCLEVKTDALDVLELENLATVVELGRCRKANDWPGTPDDWKKIEPPPTALAEFGNIVADIPEGVDPL